MPTANYLEAGSELKVKFELAYPINAAVEKTETEVPRALEVKQVQQLLRYR